VWGCILQTPHGLPQKHKRRFLDLVEAEPETVLS
jgi:hypothetical protein